MIIPHTELDPEVLYALIEEIVTRDGTDYGEIELTTEEKVNRAMALLESKKLFITYSELHESCTLQSKEAYGK